MISTLLSIDRHLFLFFNSAIANPVFDVLFPYITEVDTWVIPALVLMVVFYRKEGIRAVYVLCLAVLLVAITDPLCVQILKPWFHRLRPCAPTEIIPGARYLIGTRSSYSFPSAHAMNIFAQAALFSLAYRKKWIYFMGFAVLIGFSRIYVGVHYPLDVIGGAMIGCFCGGALYFLSRAFARSPMAPYLRFAVRPLSQEKR